MIWSSLSRSPGPCDPVSMRKSKRQRRACERLKIGVSANLEQANLKKLQSLPDGKQQEVLALVESLLEKEQTAPHESTRRPIAEIFEELSSQVPFEEWAELPRDGAEQHDHYLYGSPQRS